MERDIWFKKVLWAYFPCSPKGWAFLFILVAVVLCAVGVVIVLPISDGAKDFLHIAIFVAAFIFALSVTKQHV